METLTVIYLVPNHNLNFTVIICKNKPDMYSILTFDNLFKSVKEAETLSNPPKRLSMPSVRHMRKNNTDQTGAAGMLRIASENAINTKPGPRAACRQRKMCIKPSFLRTLFT